MTSKRVLFVCVENSCRSQIAEAFARMFGAGQVEALSAGPAITMGCGDECPLVQAGLREDWGILDPKELPANQFRRIRDDIGEKVRQLLQRV